MCNCASKRSRRALEHQAPQILPLTDSAVTLPLTCSVIKKRMPLSLLLPFSLISMEFSLIPPARLSRQWRIWAREQGIDEEKVMAIAHGVRAVEVIRAVAPHLDAEAKCAAGKTRGRDDHEGVVVMPGAVELVRSIPEGRWCVVTSGRVIWQRSPAARWNPDSEGHDCSG